MPRILTLGLALLLLTFLGACAAAPAAEEDGDAGAAYQKLSAEEAKELLDSGAALILVDVRRGDEYEAEHIPGALNIPNETIGADRPEALEDLDATILVYCRTGVRSQEAAAKLIDLGYSDLRDLGGITSWPYDTVSGPEPGVYPRPEAQ